MKVLVVDDSIVFRSQISASLSGVENVEVIGTAANGKIALLKLQQQQVDLITLDMEMPELNGLETIKEMKRLEIKAKIIVFSSQTISGAEKALEALAAGADDVVAKPSSDDMSFDKAQKMIEEALIPRVLQFSKSSFRVSGSPGTISINSQLRPAVSANYSSTKKNLKHFSPKAVVIASSTGGPNALETIFENLKCVPSVPIFIVQHMPPVFTQILARRLGEISGIPVHEATDGQRPKGGNVYLAPGGYHMFVHKDVNGLVIKLTQDHLRNSVRPAADFLFESAEEIFHNQLLGVVLTGMGEDGAAGAKRIHDAGGGIVIQDKESCVVFGMPGAVFVNDTYDDILNLSEITQFLKTVIV
jgi:two-component system chemotaxis response regulator CheB